MAELKKIGVVNMLRRCRLSTGLPPHDLESVAGITAKTSLAKGNYLFREGDPASGFFIVQRGSVNVHRVNAAGKELVIHVFRTRDSFGEKALASEKRVPGRRLRARANPGVARAKGRHSGSGSVAV